VTASRAKTAAAIAFTDLSRRPSTYLVNHLRWAADGSQTVTHGMPEANADFTFLLLRLFHVSLPLWCVTVLAWPIGLTPINVNNGDEQ
jgi:hypothetical protein